MDEVGRAVERMTPQQRARLGALLTELDAAEAALMEAQHAWVRAQAELAARRAIKQRRLDAIESLVAAAAAAASR